MHTLTHRHDTQNLNAFLRKWLGRVLGYMKHLFELETTNSQTLQTGTAVTGLEKSSYKRIALKVDPPGLAPRPERAHDPACFSSFSC